MNLKIYYSIIFNIFYIDVVYSQSSNMLNQARLKVLKVREDHVRNCLDEARKRLDEIAQDRSKYSGVLKALTVQALYQVINFL